MKVETGSEELASCGILGGCFHSAVLTGKYVQLSSGGIDTFGILSQSLSDLIIRKKIFTPNGSPPYKNNIKISKKDLKLWKQQKSSNLSESITHITNCPSLLKKM
ncbi:unnamed protein product [Larinioides sclopetarius]|uniref:Uncharacterized protein n=1 Tax=Larinioides sclopetarius TaxID=280406 RepID=A0AAV1ZM96_9ARAC